MIQECLLQQSAVQDSQAPSKLKLKKREKTLWERRRIRAQIHVHEEDGLYWTLVVKRKDNSSSSDIHTLDGEIFSLKIICVQMFVLINFRSFIWSSKFFCVICFIRVLNFHGWSQLRNYFNSEIFHAVNCILWVPVHVYKHMNMYTIDRALVTFPGCVSQRSSFSSLGGVVSAQL